MTKNFRPRPPCSVGSSFEHNGATYYISTVPRSFPGADGVFQDADRGSDGARITFPVYPDPVERAARTLHAIVYEAAEDDGQDPSIEVSLCDPAESRWGCWEVQWEAGPHNWAVEATNGIDPIGLDGELDLISEATQFFAEPGYSFSVCFYGVDT